MLSFLSVGSAFANETDLEFKATSRKEEKIARVSNEKTSGPLVCSTVAVTTGNDEVTVTVECTKCSINASEAFAGAFGCAAKKIAIATTVLQLN